MSNDLLEMIDTLVAHVNGAHLARTKEWSDAHLGAADLTLLKIQSKINGDEEKFDPMMKGLLTDYVLVPFEPTEDMLASAACVSHDDTESGGGGFSMRKNIAKKEYKAMLASVRK